MTAIGIVSPPWPLYQRPSLQLGALKAFIETRLPGVEVHADHFYLEVAAALGYRLYQEISERSRLAESLFAALGYPERRERCAALFRRHAAGNPTLRAEEFDRLTARLERLADGWLAARPWERLPLVGFSIALCQLTAGLYLIRRLKSHRPQTAIVVGGSAFDPQSARAALELFPEIDAVVVGEGELPLAGLVAGHILEGRPIAEIPPVPGLFTRAAASAPSGECLGQVASLDELPYPDFREYFETLARLDPDRRFFPTLPLEWSRGCWWQRPEGSLRSRGCAFCNLNRQWRGYRFKSPGRAAAELEALTRRHKTLSVALVDNVLPPRAALETADRLAALGRDFAIFAEARAPLPLDHLRRLRDAGVSELQAGVESLSSRLLSRLGKGTRAIHNLELMKNCAALGIRLHGNLITGFPGSGEEEVRETLAAIEFVRVFRPLKPVRFWLGRGSPVARRPGAFGIHGVRNDPFWAALFPERIFRRFPFVLQTYRGDRARQARLWRPVATAAAAWERSYTALQAAAPGRPILSMRDGGDFLILRERRPAGEAAVHRLEGPSRALYLFCGRRRRLRRIREAFPRIPEDRLLAFLRRMSAARLLFMEGDECLSLAVAEREGRRPFG